MVPSEEEARAALARGVYYAPQRDFDYQAEPRILKQSIEQGEIELLSVEDPISTSSTMSASGTAA